MAKPSHLRLIRTTVALLVVGAVVLVVVLVSTNNGGHHPVGSPPTSTVGGTVGSSPAPSLPGIGQPGTVFTYGYDLSNQAPIALSSSSAGALSTSSSTANSSATAVMRSVSPVYADQAIYGFGVGDPEPSPGVFKMGGLAARISLITSAGDTPVITLVSAPTWMKGAATTSAGIFATPPTPSHYADYAALCAHIAQSFPQVKYFVVWSEMRGFYLKPTATYDYQDYTTMYNDVYTAIKAVRPDALVGGPYAAMSTFPQPTRGMTATLPGANGYFENGQLQTVSYWITHKVGADFLAVDGSTEVAKSGNAALETPATAARQYAVVDNWIRGQTSLPIWWMESHIQPAQGWTDQQAAAARVATLAEMAASGASTGMQWQPQQQAGWPDEGLWTSTLDPAGGQPTPLVQALTTALPVLERGPQLVAGQPDGVVVATDSAGTVAINTTNSPATATTGAGTISLQPGQVELVP
jgi:hypothetical protein